MISCHIGCYFDCFWTRLNLFGALFLCTLCVLTMHNIWPIQMNKSSFNVSFVVFSLDMFEYNMNLYAGRTVICYLLGKDDADFRAHLFILSFSPFDIGNKNYTHTHTSDKHSMNRAFQSQLQCAMYEYKPNDFFPLSRTLSARCQSIDKLNGERSWH